MMSKYLIIGDVHGCYRELEKMIFYYSRGRKIIFVGDLLDKGPDSVRCVTLAMVLGAVCVKGNHEELHIRYRKHALLEKETGKKNPMNRPKDFRELNKSLGNSPLPVFSWLNSLPDYYEIPGEGTVVIHGGLLPGKSPADMDPKQLCRVRRIKPSGKMASLSECNKYPEYPFWTSLYEGKQDVVYGHAPFLKPRIDVGKFADTWGLDTGCVYGNKLSGLLLPEREIVQVDALDTYCNRNWDRE